MRRPAGNVRFSGIEFLHILILRWSWHIMLLRCEKVEDIWKQKPFAERDFMLSYYCMKWLLLLLLVGNSGI